MKFSGFIKIGLNMDEGYTTHIVPLYAPFPFSAEISHVRVIA